MLALPIYRGDKVRQIHKALASNYLQRAPEFILEAHARLVAVDHDRALDDSRFHEDTPVVIELRQPIGKSRRRHDDLGKIPKRCKKHTVGRWNQGDHRTHIAGPALPEEGWRLSACQTILNVVGNLLADVRQIEELLFAEDILGFVGKLPIHRRLVSKVIIPIRACHCVEDLP
jgi:hypothetical protein